MKTHIVQIGNSQEIQIPKALLKQLNWSGDLEIIIEANQLIIRPIQSPARIGWEQQFRRMAEYGDDYLDDNNIVTLTDWDIEEWEWG